MSSLRRFSGWIGAFGFFLTLLLAWGIAPTPVKGRSERFHSIFYKRLHNMTPSVGWSPNSRYLAFHSLQSTPSYLTPHLYRRSTRSRIFRRSTRSRVYLRSTRSRIFRRSTRSRIFRRSTRSHVFRRAPRGRIYIRKIRRNVYAEKLYTTDNQRSRLGVIDVFQRRLRTMAFRTHRRSTTSVALFRPRWINRTVVLTSTGFSGEAQLINTTTQKRIPLQRLVTAHPHPRGNMIVGRVPQTGVFLIDRRNPQKQYALVDKRRKISGYLPKFSPDGSMLAWIDANHDYSAATLRLYAFPYRSETLARDVNTRVRSPWSWEKNIYPAIEMREIKLPDTGPVVDFVWGPQSRRIAFVRGNGYTGAGTYKHTSKGLFLLQLEGEKARIRALHETGDQPSFLPGGSIAYHINHRGRDEIWFWNAQKGGKTFVTTGHEPRISPNGRYLAYLRWLPSSSAWSSNAQLFLGILALP